MSANEAERSPSPVPEEEVEDDLEETSLPFPPGKLTPEHEEQLKAIRAQLKKWLVAIADWQKRISGSRGAFKAATLELAQLQVAEPYKFTPPPPYTFRAVLLSITKCYWMALMASFDEGERAEVKKRLALIPHMRLGKNPDFLFNGERCVDNADSLTAEEYEGLMRAAMFTVIGMASQDLTKMWRELGEVGVQTWEEVF